MKLVRDIDFVFEVIRKLIPNKTVNFPWVDKDFRHDRIESESISDITAKSDVPVPGSSGSRFTILLLSHETNVGFLGGFWKI